MLDDVAIRQPVIRKAGYINLMGSATTAGQAYIRFTRFARPIDDAADDGHRHRNVDMFQPLFNCLNRADDIELLTGAGRAGNHGHAAPPQTQ